MKNRGRVFSLLITLTSLLLSSCNLFSAMNGPRKRSSSEPLESSIPAVSSEKDTISSANNEESSFNDESSSSDNESSSSDDESSSSSSYSYSDHRHDYTDWEVEIDPTCTEPGIETRTCRICGQFQTRELPLIDHNFVEDTSRAPVPPSCTQSGLLYTKCSVCGTEGTEEIVPLGHVYAKDNYGNDIVDWTVEPTCTEDGVGIKQCVRCNRPVTVTVPATGHNLELFQYQNADYDEADVRIYKCTNCDYAELCFAANQVTASSRERIVFKENDTEVGVRFFGHPIGNDVPLDEDGNPDSDNHPMVFNKEQSGDFFQYIFYLTDEQAALFSNSRCYCDAQPAPYLGLTGLDFWARNPSDTEWTPGMYIDDNPEHQTVDGDGNVIGKEITDYRYALYVDDVFQDFDHETSVSVPIDEPRMEYVMPYTFNLHAGKNKISLHMAGGYRSTFYNFTFKPYVAPVLPHEHDWQNQETISPNGEDYVEYTIGHCPEDNAACLTIKALDGKLVGDAKIKNGTRDGYMKLSSNNTSISYMFNYNGPQKVAKLYQVGFIESYSANVSRVAYTAAQTSQQLGPMGCNFGINFNGEETEIDEATKKMTFSELLGNAKIDAGSDNSKAGPCLIGNVILKPGFNVFSYTRYASYNLCISDFWLVFEE